jgi:hypothetical protein
MTTRSEEKAKFIQQIVKASKLPADKAERLAKKLWHLGPESERLATASCNRELTKYENKRDDELDLLVKAIGVELGLNAYRQNDPRGWTIRVEVGRDLATCWDGETVGCG